MRMKRIRSLDIEAFAVFWNEISDGPTCGEPERHTDHHYESGPIELTFAGWEYAR